jgi:threonylcarbamoyladenosine tRNA methylthiotransferase MtaB
LRLRLSSLEPEDFGQRIIDIFAREPVLCPHLHLPLQSGSNCILERMGRKYRGDDYLRLIEQAHRQIADLCVSTDIMVGFPGESEDDFQETLSIVERCGFSKVHSFSFSIRPGTRAADMPEQVPFPVARQRRELLDRFALAKAEETRRKLLGRTMPVLVETCKNGVAEGLTPNYLRVRFPGKSGVTPNTVADVILKKASGLMVEGESMDEHGSTGTDKTED